MQDILFTNGLTIFIISSLVILFLTIIINGIIKGIINRLNKKYSNMITTNQYIYQTIRTSIWIIGVVLIIKQIAPLSSIGDTLLGATSIIAVAVGIAAQATFGNYIAGFFLAIHQPFKVGDIIYIKERGLSGTVKEITFRHTVLLTQEQTEIIIPNTVMNSAVVEDMSNGNYSELIELQVSRETNLIKLQEIIDEIINEESSIHNKRKAELVIRDLSKNGYKVAFPIHTDSLSDYVKAKNNILPKLSKRLADNNIELI